VSKGKGKPSSPPPATPQDEERRLYEREYASVRPLPPGPTRIPLVPGAARSHGAATQRMQPTDGIAVRRHHGLVTGATPGVSRQTVRMLGRGELPVEATCDLHGMRAEPARGRLARFIEDSVRSGRRAVLVVCGRGLHSGPLGPVLLEVAIEVLASAHPQVLAFTSAPPRQGGEGALMVLLRRG
jgi:DNA-nicking Smr family endonuclease